MSDNLSCSICLESYDPNVRIPRLLPKCFHTFCQVCLKDLYKTPSMVECPTCRTHNQVAFTDLPKNRDIIQFIEYINNNNNNSKNQVPATRTASHNSSSSITQNVTQTNRAQSAPQSWDPKDYFRTLFKAIDHNSDGEINFNELHEALKRGQPNSEFDPITVGFLLSKYDSNSDNEINFEEFYNLFISVNDQYNQFLDIDQDYSGYIDAKELEQAMRGKGFQFSSSFFAHLYNELKRQYNKSDGITFDLYVRTIARFDYLKDKFNRLDNFTRSSQYNNNLEQFMGRNFFV